MKIKLLSVGILLGMSSVSFSQEQSSKPLKIEKKEAVSTEKTEKAKESPLTSKSTQAKIAQKEEETKAATNQQKTKEK